MKKLALFATLFIASLGSLSAQRLIVRMDDIGATHSENVAVIKCYQEGIGRVAEIMPVCPWFLEGARMCNENPGLDVGIHIAFNSEWCNYKWKPLTHCPSLCDEDGYLKGITPEADMKEAEAEMRAQIELGMKYTKNVTHVTDHMMWTFMPGMNDMVERVAKDYGLFYQGGKGDSRYSLETLGFIMGQKDRETGLLELLKKAEKGHTYWVIEHPGLDNEEMQSIYTKSPDEKVGTDRQNVTDAFCSQKVMQYIKESGIELITFKQAYDESQKQ